MSQCNHPFNTVHKCNHDEFICCGKEMKAVGFTFGNGWQCEICGHKEYDVASYKMSGNYDMYIKGAES